MKRWQNWLVPVLTFLTVLVLALLPRQVSEIQDRQRTGGVHSEELSSDSNFPFQPPDLAKRFDMIGHWYAAMEYGEFDLLWDVAEVYQHSMDPAEQPELCQKVMQELDALAEAEILGEELPWQDSEIDVLNRIYLRDTDSLAGASFLMVDMHNKSEGCVLHLILDEESGQALSMQINSQVLRKYRWEPEELTEAGLKFLARLGIRAELVDVDAFQSIFSLEDSDTGFTVVRIDDLFLFDVSFSGPYATDGSSEAAAGSVKEGHHTHK